MSSVAVSECSRPEENHRADRRRDSGERQSSFRPGAPPIDLGRAHQSVLPIAPRPEKDGARWPSRSSKPCGLAQAGRKVRLLLILLHTRHDVTVRVERCAHTRVPESLADHFWADAKSQQMGGVAVAQVVKANTRESSDSISFANPAVHRFQREAGTGTSYFVLRKKPAWRCRADDRDGR